LDTDEIGKWLRLAYASESLTGYISAHGDQVDPIAGGRDIGIAMATQNFVSRALKLAFDAELGQEFSDLFLPKASLEDTGTPKLAFMHAQLVAVAGWLRGHVEAITLRERLEAEAEALTRQLTKRPAGFGA
jgi:hypothetical protein